MPPDRFRFQMEKGVTVGGRVLDQDRRPVAGATVVINVRKHYPDSEQKPDLLFVHTLSGADGRWSFSNVPEQSDAVEVGTYHHLYLTDDQFFEMNVFQPLSALRDRTAVLKLRAGTSIHGIVLGPDSRPVPDAAVLYGEESSIAVNRIPPVKTDAQGPVYPGGRAGCDLFPHRPMRWFWTLDANHSGRYGTTTSHPHS